MRNIVTVSKWLAGQVRPFLILLFIIVGMSALSSLCGVGMAIASKTLIDSAVSGAGRKVIWAGIAFAVVILLRTGLHASVSLLSVRAYEQMSNRIQQRLFIKLTEVEWADFSKYHSGDILTRLTSDVGMVVNGIVHILPGMVSLGVGLFAAFVTLLIYDPTLAILAFILGPTSVLCSRIFGSKMKRLHLKMQEAESSYRSYLHECIQHMLILKTFCYEKESSDRVGVLQQEKLYCALRRNRMGVATGSVLAIGYWIGYFLAFGWGAMRLSGGMATFGTLTAFLQLVEQVQSPFIGLARSLPQVVSMTASAERLKEFESLRCETRSIVEPNFEVAGIIFENVCFDYEQGNPVLKNISMEVQAGEVVGIIGTSGEGKTTLIRLILSLLKPVSGQTYFYNGHHRRQMISASTRFLISYVPQGNTLFSGTISDNLRIGCHDTTEDEIIDVLRGVDAWDFIERLPEGLNTVIGEKGLGLSEGQAQRIAIARALLRKAPILILDEATSALDSNTEHIILQTIKNLRPRPTCIIITHRISLLGICHRVWKINNGQVYETNEQVIAIPTSEAI